MPNVKTGSCGSDMRQLGLLFWKNFCLQKRSVISTLLEILIPCLFAVILLPIRTIVESEQFNETVYKPFGLSTLPRNLAPPSGVAQWNFGYQPNDSTFLNSVMKNVAINLNLNMTGFANEQSMVEFLTDALEYKKRLGGVSFTDLDPEHIAYKLRFSSSPKNSGQLK